MPNPNSPSSEKLARLLEKATQLKQDFDTLLPIKPEYEERLWKKLRLEWNYNSNHIEGNTLTFTETKQLLFFDLSLPDHSMRELEEMKAHDGAVLMVKQWVNEGARPLSESDIRTLNKLILVRNFWKEARTPDGQPTRREIEVGAYKSHPNSVQLENGEMFHYASPEETPRLMGELIDWFRANQDTHPIVLAAELHYKFICIHPFDDGNGRVARLLVNWVLMKNGYQPVVIKSKEKDKYLRALQKADAGDIDAFSAYIAEQAMWSLELGVKAANGESVDEEEDIYKELNLFKREALRKDIVSFKSEYFTELWESNLEPIHDLFYMKMEEFNSLFSANARQFTYWKDLKQYYKSEISGDFKEHFRVFLLESDKSLDFTKSPRKIRFTKHFRNYIGVSQANFAAAAHLTFDFSKYDFKIFDEFENSATFRYQKVDFEKVDVLITGIVRQTLADIKSKIIPL